MNPITHLLVTWPLVAVSRGIRRSERLWVVGVGLAPDLDGLGVLPELATRAAARPMLWWSEYHHVLAHNLLAGFFSPWRRLWRRGGSPLPPLLCSPSIFTFSVTSSAPAAPTAPPGRSGISSRSRARFDFRCPGNGRSTPGRTSRSPRCSWGSRSGGPGGARARRSSSSRPAPIAPSSQRCGGASQRPADDSSQRAAASAKPG